MDVATWIGSVTALSEMIKVWLETKKTSIELDKARLEIAKIVEAPKENNSDQNLITIIDPELLSELIRDIQAAMDRFAKSFNDPRYTPADIDREEERARLVVCNHLNRIRKFNGDVLPNENLIQLSKSFRCEYS
jgi:hypothetical protein